MSPVTEITSQNEFDERAHIKSNWRTRIMRSLISVLVIISVVVAWQLLNAVNPSDFNVLALMVIPTSGLGQQPGIAFSRDSGKTWKQGSKQITQIEHLPMTALRIKLKGS
jgi:hypothetical protein